MPKILIIDDEIKFRESLRDRLNLRGYDCTIVEDERDALKKIRSEEDIDVIILDKNMPYMSGEEVLAELKKYRPEIQVIFLTGHGNSESAMEAGRLDAYAYIQKPCELDDLTSTIDKARENKHKAIEKYEIVRTEKGSVKKWLIGVHNSRPGIIITGLLLFFVIILMPPPDRLLELLSARKTVQTGEINTDINQGYSDYRNLETDQNISEFYSKINKLGKTQYNDDGSTTVTPLTVEQTAFRAQVMLGVLLVAAMFWATGATPIGITALLVGVFMYFLGVLKPNAIAQSYLKDSVIFIFGVLAFSKAITKTGLDRRIGLLLLGSSKSVKTFLFLFLPLFAMACSFLSEHALIAFIMPIILIVYITSIKSIGETEDYKFAIMLFLSVNFAANCGGPGSPAAGGRNAIMMGILDDYGVPLSFGDWVVYGLPFVPVMGLVIGIYFYFACYRKSKIKKANISAIVKQAAEKIGPMNKDEYITAAVLVLLVTLWITCSDVFGMGGPVILALVLLNLFRILNWRNITKIQWEVVALYAAATAMGKGLAVTGAALYIADIFISILPEMLMSGEGLAIAVTLFTGIATNFMSDGATVSAIGPITIPMAAISGTHPWMVGLATAFASSFAHMSIIGTPNNAIVFTMARNPVTGKQLIGLKDFLIHGFAIFVLSMLVLWFWIILTYWNWIGF